MKGFHPKANRAVRCALIVAGLAAGGCRSSSSGIANNPFLSPDRVAPPSTRQLAPGQAAPYYQGDPLPVMQSATAPATPEQLAANEAAARSSSGKTLAWNSRPGAAPVASNAPDPAGTSVPPWGGTSSPTPVARVNEPTVSVPTDADTLRFELPAPSNPATTAPIATIPAGPQPALAATTPPNQSVQLASYNVPVGNAPATAAAVSSIAPQQPATSPWRSPQNAQATAPTSYSSQPYGMQPMVGPQSTTIPAVPTIPANQMQTSLPTNPMAAQLRAVSSPPQPGDPMPRIRVPGYEVQQANADDGFRPRTSMR